MKGFFRFSFTILFFALFIFSYNKLTDGFSLREISTVFHIPKVGLLTDEEKRSLDPIFNQSFSYYDRGAQMYAFISEDGKWVLKFFKQKHLRSLKALEPFCALPILKSILERKIKRREKRVAALLQASKLASTEVKEESGIIYAHLFPVHNLSKKVLIKDKLNFPREICLNDYEFVVQKRGVNLREVFKNTQDPKMAEANVKKIRNALFRLSEKGVIDQDRGVIKNMALTMDGDEAFFIDTGEFKKEKHEPRIEALKHLNTLRIWCNEFTPMYTPFFEQEIVRIKSEIKSQKSEVQT